MESKIKSASLSFELIICVFSGIHTTFIRAASPAITPLYESSITKHFEGLTSNFSATFK